MFEVVKVFSEYFINQLKIKISSCYTHCTRFKLLFLESATFIWVKTMDEMFFKLRKGCGFSIDSCVVIVSSTSDIIITLNNYFKTTHK